MLKVSSCIVGSRVVLAFALGVMMLGCEMETSPPGAQPGVVQKVPRQVQADGQPPAGQTTGNLIVSDGIINVENGTVTYGPPKVTPEVELEIYKALTFHRNIAEEIERQVPGGNRGSQQSRADYELILRGYMVRYSLSAAEIEAILKKGDDQGWR